MSGRPLPSEVVEKLPTLPRMLIEEVKDGFLAILMEMSFGDAETVLMVDTEATEEMEDSPLICLTAGLGRELLPADVDL